ncbi:receptor like protein 30-like [Prunus persica]|uniref:receptor like protein 30-like n=1 Tax=Prunus persica TaxID=3760 RepID=UPI0009AB8CAA|nr:receptor like protein 30-like [Prunus persica]
MGMESWRSKFISLHCFIFLSLIATHCFLFVQTQALAQVDECSALLQFKESFAINKSVSADPLAYPKVSFWTREGDGNRSNCCSWDGVECDEDFGHVVGLDLRSSCLYGSINSSNTLFRLVHLQRLDLSDNHFNFSQIPSRFGHDLSSLTYLNLSYSLFSGQIPSEISKLSKLSTLDLSFNGPKFDAYGIPLKLTKANMRSLVQNLTTIKQLHLNWVEMYFTVPDILVNASSLTSLQLRDCELNGEFPVGIFHLPNLEVLDVNGNSNLTGYFPNFNKSNVFKKLNVGATNFSGMLPASMGNLHSLNFLDISWCHFYPLIPSSLGNLTQLNYLDMISFNDIPNNNSTGQLVSEYSLSWIASLTNLYSLSLWANKFRGKFPSFVANLTQLSFLQLGGNEITGQIPSWLMNLTQLTTLYLVGNNLSGAIPRSLFQLQNLEILDLSSNSLSGQVEFDQFSQPKKLKELRLAYNKLSLQIITNLSATVPQLELLDLTSCNLTEFPEFLKYQSELRFLQLSDNNIQGQIPKWVWNATRETLLLLDLSSNFLTGFDQNPINLPWQNLYALDLRTNMLQGSLPIPPQSIINYVVGSNHYSGEISPSFCNLNHLHILDLSNNSLSGMLPQCLGNSSALEILMLMNNSFHGSIPQICPVANSLKMVDLSYNQLQGKVPRSMANCTRLEFLNLGNNHMRDIFPSWLGALPALQFLSLRSNGFHGMIGKYATNHDFPKLCIIDLSDNGFSGVLPSNCLENWNSMKFVDESQQTYFQVISTSYNNSAKYSYSFSYPYSITTFAKGVELKFIWTPYLLRFIDFSSNRFEGEIPAGVIGNLRGLLFLNLSNNALTGLIPSSLWNLTALESLDLSRNQLSGRIPGNLAQLTFLEYFNVSYNHLWGPIPLGQQFGTFLEDSFQGNSGLCGKPLSKKCDSSISLPPSIFEEDEDSGFQIALDWYVVLPGVVSGLIVGVVAGNFWTSKNHEWFFEKFSRKRQPRGTRGRRGHRN